MSIIFASAGFALEELLDVVMQSVIYTWDWKIHIRGLQFQRFGFSNTKVKMTLGMIAPKMLQQNWSHDDGGVGRRD